MNSNTKSEELAPDFINSIQKNASDERRVVKNKTTVKRPSNDWSEIKKDIEILKIKCADFSKKLGEADSIEEKNVLTLQAEEIQKEWRKIKAMMDKKK